MKQNEKDNNFEIGKEPRYSEAPSVNANKTLSFSIAGLTVVGMPELTVPQFENDLLPCEQPKHEHEWPQETVPYPIAHVMEYDQKKIMSFRCKQETNGFVDSNRKKYKHHRHHAKNCFSDKLQNCRIAK